MHVRERCDRERGRDLLFCVFSNYNTYRNKVREWGSVLFSDLESSRPQEKAAEEEGGGGSFHQDDGPLVSCLL